MSLSSIIIAASQWSAINHMNPHLEFSAKVLMAWDHIDTIERQKLRQFWVNQYRDRTEIKRGLFKRFPPDIAGEYRSKYSTSHDELITGICFMSYLFEGGESARRILDEGRTFGFYLSGHSPNKPIKGKWYAPIINFLDKFLDSEWLVLFNPSHKGFAKLAAGRQMSMIEREAIKINLATSKTWNLLDIKLLFLEQLNLPEFNQHVMAARKRMGTKYRGRYGSDPLYLRLWELRDEREYN